MTMTSCTKGLSMRGIRRGTWLSAILIAASAIAGCGTIDTTPINMVSNEPKDSSPAYIPDAGDDGSTVVALAFSGGGMRASAWAYGVLLGLDSMVIDRVPYERTLLDDVRTVAGTSGGAVTAAYLGYKGKSGYQDFRERFLYRNAEAYMATSFRPDTVITTVFSGGANDRTTFARWLDEKLFDHATFSAFNKPDRPIVWLTASDIYNNTPFLFSRDSFAALCSDIDKLKIADAVGASAAFPGVFAPIILQAPQADCRYARPPWLRNALAAKNPSIRLQAYARALDSYQSQRDLGFIRLLDGGLADNLGITGLTLERAAADTPYGPLSPKQAVRLRNFLFVVTDAGVQNHYKWGASPVPTRLDKVLVAASQTAIASATRSGFDAINLTMKQWQDALIRYRCGLPRSEVLRLRGTLEQWDCRDVSVTTERISFREADPALFERLNSIPTRLKLPREQVDLLVETSRDIIMRNTNIRTVADHALKHSPIFDIGRASVAAGQ